jgi:AcrR family transcriptional regulator
MARRKITIGLTPIVASLAVGPTEHPATEQILDAAAQLLSDYGLRRWTIDDVADRAGIGRTSVYRAFATREDLVHAVLARELRDTIASIQTVAAPHRKVEDRIVEGALAGLVALRGSLVEELLRSDPATFLPFLTTDAGPLIAIARELLINQARAAGASIDDDHAGELAEIAARLGLSFILTRDTVLPINDPDALRASLHRLLRPILTSLLKTRRRTA